MMNLFRHYASIVAAVCLCVAGVSCTDVDDSLGWGLVQGGSDKLTIHVDTLGLESDQMLTAFQTYTDSIGLRGSTATKRGSMNLNVGYVGSARDAVMGLTTAAYAVTSVPASPISPNLFSNRSEAFDSVKLVVNMKHIGGDASMVQTFNIYRLRDSLAYADDTLYYHSFRYEEHVDMDSPLFSFEYSGAPDDVEEVMLDVLPAGEELMAELLAADTALFYTGRLAEFQEKFKGFVVAQAPGTQPDAALYANYLPNSMLNFYYQRTLDDWEAKYYDEEPGTEVTAVLQLSMSDTDGLGNTSVACIRHDYSGTPLAGVADGGKVDVTGTAYVQGLGGVAATLEFPDGFFEAIDALKPSPEYTVFINQAQMFVWLDGSGADAYDASFQSLGSYYDYGTFSVIPDYYVTGSSSSDSDIPYDGTLNRNEGKGYYKMDITSFLQHAYQNDDEESRQLTLAPSYSPYEPFAEYVSALRIGGDGGRPVAVKLTYTLIRPDGL